MGTSLLSAIDTITPTRNLNTLYIILDSIFICVFLGLLIWKKRYSTAIFALFGGVLYTIVDYGGFYLLSHSRTVSIGGEVVGAGPTFWVLLWMSMSYGITNFAFMWVLIRKDPLRMYWVFMIIMWWMICPSMSELGGEATIETFRTTGKYHGWMAVVMATQWIFLMILLMRNEKKKAFVNILWLCVIGFSVQFGWEFALLINGIRPLNGASIQTLIVNSFLETNMCMPTTYLVYYLWSKRFTEDMKRSAAHASVGEGISTDGAAHASIGEGISADGAAHASVAEQPETGEVVAANEEIPADAQPAENA